VKKLLILIALSVSSLILSVAGCGSASKKAAQNLVAPTTLDAAVAAPYGSPEMVVRDQYRHPLETLKFFGVTPAMTVVEISPSAGWYTQILAPYLNTSGQYVAAAVPNVNEYMTNMNTQRQNWMSQHSSITSKAQTVEFNPSQSTVPENSADMVLTFRNVHNWMASGDEQKAFNSFYRMLKPGGVLGVVEHRAAAHQKRDPKAKSGYVLEKDVIAMAKKAGFKLVEKSEINANPKDTKDHPEGVWTLPPALRLKDKDKEKYLAIGESDRMTLKFVKPEGKKKL